LTSWLDEKEIQIEAYCPNCNSPDINIWDDGSGFCKSCKKSFSQYKTIKRCLKCGSTELKRYEDKDVQYVSCKNCNERVPLNDFIKRSESEYECDNCGTRVLESDKKCPKCGERLEDDAIKKKISKTGYYLMCLGATLYFVVSIISFVYTPDYRDIEDVLNYSRLMTAIGFMGVLTFMFGSIKQIKELL